jgi:hypothetical protein
VTTCGTSICGVAVRVTLTARAAPKPGDGPIRPIVPEAVVAPVPPHRPPPRLTVPQEPRGPAPPPRRTGFRPRAPPREPGADSSGAVPIAAVPGRCDRRRRPEQGFGWGELTPDTSAAVERESGGRARGHRPVDRLHRRSTGHPARGTSMPRQVFWLVGHRPCPAFPAPYTSDRRAAGTCRSQLRGQLRSRPRGAHRIPILAHAPKPARTLAVRSSRPATLGSTFEARIVTQLQPL